MPIVESHCLIHGPQESIFQLAQDYDLRLEWDPFLKAMKFHDGAIEAAVGVKVWVRAWNGLTMTVEYITLQPPRFVAMKMLQGPFFFEMFAGSWGFEQVGENTKVVFKYNFRVKKMFQPWLLNPIIQWVFLRDIRQRLFHLKKAVEETDILQRLPDAPGREPEENSA